MKESLIIVCVTYSNTSQYIIEAQEVPASTIPFSLPVDMPLNYKVSAARKAVVIPRVE